MGRPSKFKPEFVEQAMKLCALGATDRDVAEFFEVSERTLARWKHEQPEFCQALNVGKGASDDRVAQSLYRRATGYSYDAVKIMTVAGQVEKVPYVEHVPPDTTACIFWLKNRRPVEWRDVQKHEHSVHGADDLTDEQLAAIVRAGSGAAAADPAKRPN